VPGQQIFEPLLVVSPETKQVTRGTKQFGPNKLVQQETSNAKVVQDFFDPARLLKRAGSKIEPKFSCLSLVERSLQGLLPTCILQFGVGCNAKFAWGSPLPD
jgi:hypothetical protein